MPSHQGRMFIATVPCSATSENVDFLSSGYTLPKGVIYIRGQKEIGGETGYEHYQIYLHTDKKITCSGVRKLLGGTGHVELTRSRASLDYVWKASTSVPG